MPAWAALALAGSALLAVGDGSGPAAADAVPVLLLGRGDSDTFAELVAWQNALYAAEQPTDLSYVHGSTSFARRDLLAGTADFVFSGVPFTAAELAARPAGAPEIIEAPISVAALAVVFTTPVQKAWEIQIVPDDPICETDEYDPAICDPRIEQYDGTFRIPPHSLAALILGVQPRLTGQQWASWSDPTWLSLMQGEGRMSVQSPLYKHTWVNRAETSGQNKYLMEYARAMSREVWDARLAENPEFPWEPIGEQMSPNTRPTKDSTDQVAAAITLHTNDPSSNNSAFGAANWTGNAGAVPSTMMPKLIANFPKAGLKVMEIQNANGDWVLPTTETITKAIEASTEPNIAATTVVPGAYPLVYLNRLYTVAGTLTPEQANSLAASVRYLALDGQQEVVNRGGASLTPALQAEALAAADEIVVKNCTADGYEVTTSGPSVYEPDFPGVQALTSMAHCTAVPVASTTTVAETTTTTTVAESTTTSAAATSTTSAAESTTTTALVASQSPAASGSTNGSTNGSSYTPTYTPSVTQAPATTAASAGESTTTVLAAETTVDAAEAVPDSTVPAAAQSGAGRFARGVPLTGLPMVPPDDGSAEFKKLGTLLLGAALFLLGRRIVHARTAGSA